MQANGWTVSFEVSALEIYNENIRDLLTDSVACDKSKLDIVMDAKTGETYVKNLSSETVSSEQDIYSLLNLAASRRETAAIRPEDPSRTIACLFLQPLPAAASLSDRPSSGRAERRPARDVPRTPTARDS